MKVYIATDLEGISGVTVWDQTREMTTQLYQQARELLTEEVYAAVEGCVNAGADEIVVLDGHGGGFNFVPEDLHPGATYVTGPGRPGVLCGLDESFDAAILLGYHAMAGTPNAVLAHTQSSKRGDRYWYNGRESGEIAQSALVCGHYNVPVVMVTGDDATCAEAHAFLGDEIVTVSVKKGLGITSCQMMAPQAAWEKITESVGEALGRIGRVKPYQLDLPITARLSFPRRETADAAGCIRSKRIDEFTYERVLESALEVVKF